MIIPMAKTNPPTIENSEQSNYLGLRSVNDKKFVCSELSIVAKMF